MRKKTNDKDCYWSEMDPFWFSFFKEREGIDPEKHLLEGLLETLLREKEELRQTQNRTGDGTVMKEQEFREEDIFLLVVLMVELVSVELNVVVIKNVHEYEKNKQEAK